jgi:hypothetical protein
MPRHEDKKLNALHRSQARRTFASKKGQNKFGGAAAVVLLLCCGAFVCAAFSEPEAKKPSPSSPS